MKYLILATLLCAAPAMASSFTVTSPAFSDGGQIPVEFTCDGAGEQFPLIFSNVPKETKSFVVTVEDPDIPEEVKKTFKIKVFDHMVVYNVPGTVKEFKNGSAGEFAKNTKGDKLYKGPCPPSGTHRYITTVYALKKELLPNLETKEAVLKAFSDKDVLEKAQLTGTYTRKAQKTVL